MRLTRHGRIALGGSELHRNNQGVFDGRLTCFQEMPAFHEFLFGTIKERVQLQVQGPIHRVFMLHRKWNERSTGGVFRCLQLLISALQPFDGCLSVVAAQSTT
jgi:hypothetical protein